MMRQQDSEESELDLRAILLEGAVAERLEDSDEWSWFVGKVNESVEKIREKSLSAKDWDEHQQLVGYHRALCDVLSIPHAPIQEAVDVREYQDDNG